MQELKKHELMHIAGGINLNGTIINALSRGIDTLMEVGRSLGSAIRRWKGNMICPI